MWTRSLLKSNAKNALKGRYWRSFGLCLLLSLLGIGAVVPQVTAQYRMNTSSLGGLSQSLAGQRPDGRQRGTAFAGLQRF